MRIQFFLPIFLINATIATAAQLQEVASFPDKQITGVGVSTKSGRIFVNFPYWSDDHSISVAEIVNGQPKAFPNDEWNTPGPAGSHFVCVQSVIVDDQDNYLNTPELAKVVIAGDVLHDSIPVVRPDASLIEALERFRHHDGERLPVVNDSATKCLIGTIAKTDVILALAGRSTRSATTVGSPPS